MSGITLGSNILALQASRRLSEATQATGRSFERLSSGLRINRASDDAAGLAIATGLTSDSRVFAQGIRNINDGISSLSIASSALDQLTGITVRLKELATQAANGSFGRTQRLTLDSEAFSLTNEFNRIVASTSFNGRKLLDASLTNLRIQAGYGTEGGIAFGVGQQISRMAGYGSFQSGVTISGMTGTTHIVSADFNRDGKLDIFEGGSVRLGDGAGGFGTALFIDGSGPVGATVTDFNNDGFADIATYAISGNQAFIFLGNGDGTFQSSISVPTVGGFVLGAYPITAGDLNGDGNSDLLTSDGATLVVHLGNGNGTFRAGQSSSFSGTNFKLIDVNSDGKLDLASTSGPLQIALGNGNGTFGPRRSYTSGATGDSINFGDFNHDGIQDIAMLGSRLSIFLGNADGSFQRGVSYNPQGGGSTSGSIYSLEIGDLNGDGILDVVGATGGRFFSMLGNTDGTFKAAVRIGTDSAGGLGSAGGMALGDFNGDGVLDLVGSGDTSQMVYSAVTERVSSVGRLNLTTQTEARNSLTILDGILNRIGLEKGTIGSGESRLFAALNTLQATRENYIAAGSRISDTDVASDSAQLVRNQILQQTSSAVLAQANVAPQLALLLLR